MLMIKSSFAGREFQVQVVEARQKLYEIRSRMVQIRTHLCVGLSSDEIVLLSVQERNMYFEKFDALWTEFVGLKSFFSKQLENDHEKRMWAALTILLRRDKNKYDRERRINMLDPIIANLFHRLSISSTEALIN